jgi:hypothetical protein
VNSVAEPYHPNIIDSKVAKSLYINPVIVEEPYHLSGDGSVITKVLHEIFFPVSNSFVSEPYHFHRAGAVTRFKLARCDVGVKLL